METKILTLALFFSLTMANGFSQDKPRELSKEEQKLEKQKQIEAIVNAREFVFVARMANPTGMRSVNLASNPNFMKFSPDLIESEMPFYGKAYSSIGYGSDAGMKFKEKPDEFTVEKSKKEFDIKVVVKGETDNYKIYLSVGFEGNTMISINCNNRSSISYRGEISAPQKPEEKK
jgi:hypothetical protein